MAKLGVLRSIAEMAVSRHTGEGSAAKYLKHSYEELNSWPLAVTSYNHGLAGIVRAVKQTGSKDLGVIIRKYNGRTFGFASSNFYCEFLAALEVDRNAATYFPGIQREKAWTFDEVRLGRSIYFKDLVALSGESAEDIEKLNLAFRSNILRNRVRIPSGSVVKVPYGDGPKLVAKVSSSNVLPVSGAAVMQASLRQPGQVPSGKRYKVKRGDTVGAIARRYRISAEELMDANGIRNPRRLRAGQTIIIPGVYPEASSSASAPRAALSSTSSASSGLSTVYTVKSGDALSEIARKYSVSTKSIMRTNGLKSAHRIYAGQKLKIPGGGGGDSGAAGRVHKVVRGDNLSKIAKKYSTSVAQLRKLNPKLGKILYPGQVLRVD